MWDIFTGWHRWSVDHGIAASLPDRGDIDGVDCKNPVTSAKRIYDLLCNGIGLQHGTASDSDGDRCDLYTVHFQLSVWA